MKFLYFIGVVGVFTMMSFMLVDFYSSMTKVDYVEGSKSLKFTTKVNTEHIANAVKVASNSPSFEGAVKRYIGSNVSVTVNGSSKNLTFTGSQVKGETVWVYYEANGVEDIKSLRMKNSILFDAYPKQFNVVNIAYKGQQKTLNFQKGKEVNEVSF